MGYPDDLGNLQLKLQKNMQIPSPSITPRNKPRGSRIGLAEVAWRMAHPRANESRSDLHCGQSLKEPQRAHI